jgi:hypothetical protein
LNHAEKALSASERPIYLYQHNRGTLLILGSNEKRLKGKKLIHFTHYRYNFSIVRPQHIVDAVSAPPFFGRAILGSLACGS